MVGAAGQGHSGATATHIPAENAHAPLRELLCQPDQKRRAVMVSQTMREDGDPPAGLPAGWAIVVHSQGVAIVEIDSPQDRSMFRQALGHKRGADGLGVRAAQPPGGFESRRRFCGSVGGHGQEFTTCLDNIPGWKITSDDWLVHRGPDGHCNQQQPRA